MAVTWTKEQQQVINIRDCDLLISAAAGSGKTAVLVERILSRIMDPVHPTDIDRMLVVTFTNAAASEMKERIRNALEAKLEENPENVHLQRQSVLIHQAQITTIHSFCLHILRSHFHLIGLDPAFRVADTGETKLIEQDAVREILDEAYEAGEESFFSFMETISVGKTDDDVSELIVRLGHFALGHPFPEDWLQDCCRMYGQSLFPEDLPQAVLPLNAQPWMREFLEETRSRLTERKKEYEELLPICLEKDGPAAYAGVLTDRIAQIEMLNRTDTYEAFGRILSDILPVPKLPPVRAGKTDEEKKEQVNRILTQGKKELEDLKEQFFYDTPEKVEEEFYAGGKNVCTLARLTAAWLTRFARKKEEKNILDYSDLEHKALQILVRKKDDQIISTDAAGEYAEQFEEIMTDEYQDSSLIQELILESISRRDDGRHNRFMVGDVKQSIYRFRLARPEMFLKKYRTYENAAEGKPASAQECRIDLHKNFRSRKEILSFINHLFRQIMTENPGEMIYDDAAALYAGASFPEGQRTGFLPVEILLADLSQKDDSGETVSLNSIEAEAAMTGKKILEIVGRESVWDKEKNAMRPVKWSDIAILLRTGSGWADTFRQVLEDMGIPAHTGSRSGYFSASEVRTVLCCLRILDNPRQDIPLAAVLRSPMAHFTEEELSRIRIAYPDGSFYDACRKMAGEARVPSDPSGYLSEKLGRFLKLLDELREKSAYMPVHRLIWEILDDTGYGDYISALPAGFQRKANLDMLTEKAAAYEKTSYRGLYHFVRYIEQLKKYEVDFGEAELMGEGDDAVRILTIHKSKGLEYPVVFVSGLQKQFNEKDASSLVVMHPDLGAACPYADLSRRIRTSGIFHRIIGRRIRQESLAEEMRVLYVALTRAKEKLYLTGAVKDFEKKMQEYARLEDREEVPLPSGILLGARSFLDWILPALIRKADDEVRMNLQVLPVSSGWENDMEDPAGTGCLRSAVQSLADSGCQDETAGKWIKDVLSRSYPFAGNREIRGSLSVSELKKAAMLRDEWLQEAEQLVPEEPVIPLLPRFRQQETEISGAARGTVYHMVMQNYQFSSSKSPEIQLEELVKCGRMSRDEVRSVRPEDIRTFLASGIGIRVAEAWKRGALYREQPFVIGVPADTVRKEWSPGEMVLVQGIIDVFFFEEDGSITLLDYKTDRVNSADVLLHRYRAQMEYYAMALERLTKRPVRQKILYSFYLGDEIIVS